MTSPARRTRWIISARCSGLGQWKATNTTVMLASRFLLASHCDGFQPDPHGRSRRRRSAPHRGDRHQAGPADQLAQRRTSVNWRLDSRGTAQRPDLRVDAGSTLLRVTHAMLRTYAPPHPVTGFVARCCPPEPLARALQAERPTATGTSLRGSRRPGSPSPRLGLEHQVSYLRPLDHRSGSWLGGRSVAGPCAAFVGGGSSTPRTRNIASESVSWLRITGR